ncbi:MAG: hypothetical protein ABII12_01720 [Planctomycetota bacterium]
MCTIGLLLLILATYRALPEIGFQAGENIYFLSAANYVLDHPAYAFIVDANGYDNSGDRGHFFPLFIYFMCLLRLLFHDSHSALGITVLVLHVCNAAVVGILARRLFGSYFAGWCAAALYAVNYWLCGTLINHAFYLYAAPAGLSANLGLLLILTCRNRRLPVAIGATVLLAVGLLFVEYPVGYFGVYIAAWWFTARRRGWRDAARIGVPLALLLLALVACRLVLQPYVSAFYGEVFTHLRLPPLGQRFLGSLAQHGVALLAIAVAFSLLVVLAQRSRDTQLVRGMLLAGTLLLFAWLPVALIGNSPDGGMFPLRYRYAYFSLACVTAGGGLLSLYRAAAIRERRLVAAALLLGLVCFLGWNLRRIENAIYHAYADRRFERNAIPQILSELNGNDRYHVLIANGDDRRPGLSMPLAFLLGTKLSVDGRLSSDIYREWRRGMHTDYGRCTTDHEYTYTDGRGRTLRTYGSAASLQRAIVRDATIRPEDVYVFLVKDAKRGVIERVPMERFARLPGRQTVALDGHDSQTPQ